MKLLQRHSSDWGLTLVIFLLQALLLTSCVGGALYGTGTLEKAGETRNVEPPAPPLPTLPPQMLYQGRTLPMDALADMAPQYDYIIMDRDGRDQYLPLQSEVAKAILNSQKWNAASPQSAKALAIRPPALALEGISLEFNPENAAASADFAAGTVVSTNPLLVKASAAYPSLLGVFQEKLGNDAQIRGLSLPAEALAQIRNGGAKSVSPAYRSYLPPVVLPMKEETLAGGQEQVSVPAQGSSESVVLRPAPPEGDPLENLKNSAMAWNAVNIAHEGLNRPLFIALDRASFDRGRGLGEAIRYFDAQSRVLQLVIVPAHSERVKAADGSRKFRLVADVPLSGLAPVHPGAEYVYLLVQPEYVP